MFEVIFAPAAAAELVEAHDWYETELPGLGVRFRAEIGNTVERIRENPLQFRLSSRVHAVHSCGVFPKCSSTDRREHSAGNSVFSREPQPAHMAKAYLALRSPIHNCASPGLPRRSEHQSGERVFKPTRTVHLANDRATSPQRALALVRTR